MRKTTALVILSLFSTLMTAQNISFDAEVFKSFVDMRVGTSKPVSWYCYGEVYT
jgi:hypothetical protein